MLRMLPVGAAERSKLDELRRLRAGLEQQLTALREQAVPLDEAVERVMHALDEPIGRARTWLQYFTHAEGGPPPSPDMELGLLMMPDLEQRLRAELAPMIPQPGLPRDKRASAIAAAETKLQQVRRDELGEFFALEGRDFVAELPADVDAAMVLETWDKL